VRRSGVDAGSPDIKKIWSKRSRLSLSESIEMRNLLVLCIIISGLVVPHTIGTLSWFQSVESGNCTTIPSYK
jgi:hypothetical protein